MGKCIYITTEGKEYQSKQELASALKEDLLSGKTSFPNKISFIVENNDQSVLEFEQAKIEEEAMINFNTIEHLSFNLTNGRLEVTIDGEAISDIEKAKKGEKLLWNSKTEKQEVYSIPELLEREKNGETIEIRNWIQEKTQYFAERIYESILNAESQEIVSKPDLKSKLYSFAQRVGIKIEALEQWLKDNAHRSGVEDVQALADMLTRTIAISNNNDVDQLSEEVAHFAIEYSTDQEMMNRMLDQVHETNVYQAEAEKYRLKYGQQLKSDGTKYTKEELERKVRKEILGKILSEKIKDNFNTETAQTSAEIGIFTQLKNLWNKFLQLFKINDTNQKFFKEFGKVLDDLSYKVINEEAVYFLPTDSKEVYFSMASDHREIHDNLKQVVDRLKASYQNVINQKGIDRASRQTKLENIENQLVYNQYVQVLNSIVSILEQDVTGVVNLINRAKEQGGDWLNNIENYDILNAINFHRNFDLFSSIIESELENLQRQGLLVTDEVGLTQAEREQKAQKIVNTLNNKLNEISKQYGQVKGDLLRLNRKRARKIVHDVFSKFGADKEAVDSALAVMDSKWFENVWFITEWLYPLRGVANNPIFQAISALMVIATQQVNKATTDFANNLIRIIKQNNVSDSDAKWLIKGGRLRNGQNTNAINTFLNYLKEDYQNKINILDEKIAKAEDSEKYILQNEKVRLMEEMQRKLHEQEREWIEQSLNEERLKEMDGLSKSAKNILLNRALSKRKILDKYRLADGSIPFHNISNADLISLAHIEDAYRQNLSPYSQDGSLKTGIELHTAKDLMQYHNTILKNNQDTPYRFDDFKNAAKEQGIDLNDTGNLTDSQKKWLQANAIYTYSEEVKKMLDQDGGIKVDTENMPILDESVIKEMLGEKTFEGTWSNLDVQLPNESQLNAPENYQAIYDALVEKRQHLVAPYKVQGKPGEIDGNVLTQEQHKLILDAINITSLQISKFKLEKRADITIIHEGNDAYNKRLQELENASQAEINHFKYNVAKVEWIGDKEVPTAYQYRRSRIADKDKNKFPKTYQPNFRWQHTEGLERYLNKKYNKKFAGKTVQLKLDNKKLDQKIPKDVLERLKKDNIEVNDGMTFRDLFIDKEFFEKFGIDQTTDFWGEKGATKNTGLWKVREFILTEKDKADTEYGLKYHLFELPQVHATWKEILDKGLRSSLRAQVGVDLLDENDEEVIGDKDRVTVPKRYLHKMRPDLLSDDISRLYGKYVQAANNYKYKNAIVPEIQILTERLKNSEVRGAKAGNVASTKVYQMLDKWLSVHLYGNLVDEVNWMQRYVQKGAEGVAKILPVKFQPYVQTVGKISPSKFLRQIYKYIRNTNLGLNPVTPLVNFINSATNTTMEHLSENQVSRDSLLWASEQTSKNFIQHIGDSGAIDPKSKLMRLLRYSNMYMTPEKIFDGVTKNILYRSIDEPLFLNYRPFTVAIAAHAMFSIYDSYRLVNGEFININKFREQNKSLTEEQLREEWSKYKNKTYYTFLKEIDDGVGRVELDLQKLEKEGYFVNEKTKESKVKKAEFLEAKIKENAQRFQARIEAQANPLDKPLIYSNPFGMFLGLFSQYFFNFLYHRFSSKNYNLLENRWEEGNYRTMFRILSESLTNNKMPITDRLKEFSKILASSVTFGMYAKGLQGLEQYEQTNVKRAGVDVAMYGVLFAMFMLANSVADDDDDDWLKQYIALLSSRALLEHSSQMIPFAASDVLQRIQSPVVGTNLLENIMNIPFFFSEKASKEVTRGTYKGLTRRERDLLKLSFLNNIYKYYYRPNESYKSANRWFKSNTLNFPAQFLPEEQK